MGGKTNPPYPEAFRRQVVELYANGARIVDLAKEFQVAEQSIGEVGEERGRFGGVAGQGDANPSNASAGTHGSDGHGAHEGRACRARAATP
jgi:hypothetical protein